jgi:hypothetical protein
MTKAARTLALASVIAVAATPALAAPWVRGFIVDQYEPAFYYGAKAGTMEAGTDCPKGTTPDNDYNALLKTKWRSDAEIAKVLKPATLEVDGTFNSGREFLLSAALRYRGFRRDIDTWVNPFAAPDPGMQEVTGKIAEGFDLDNNPRTGFISPTGRKGVDNNLYRVMGCGMAYRGKPFSSYLGTRANDKMLEGLFGIVIRVSGTKDPMNDDNAVVEVGYTPERIIKDPAGKVVPDYSYRIAKAAQYTKLNARIKNGVVKMEGGADIRMPVFSWFENNRGEITFHKARLELSLNPDTSLTGLVGGYIDWRQYYGRDTFDTSSSAGTRETYYHENQLAKYYALKRNADGLPDPKTGQNMGISAAFRLTGVRAYVRDSSQAVTINEPLSSNAAPIYRALFRKASMTAVIIPDPPRRQGEDDEIPAPKDKEQQTVRNEGGKSTNGRSSDP